mmetsp:Transcript_89156/g.251011  ORF Transcript_89156/g.251011 Transcript_89156/m.251011 type:complete len:310 (+) Transcript_89156:1194-2123(+)
MAVRTFSNVLEAFLSLSGGASTALNSPFFTIDLPSESQLLPSTSPLAPASALESFSSAARASAQASSAAFVTECAWVFISASVWDARWHLSCAICHILRALATWLCDAASARRTCASAARRSRTFSSAAWRAVAAATMAAEASATPCVAPLHQSRTACWTSTTLRDSASAASSLTFSSATCFATTSTHALSVFCFGASKPCFTAPKSLAPTVSQSPNQPLAEAPSSAAASCTPSSASPPCVSRINCLVSPNAGSVHSNSARISRDVKYWYCRSPSKAVLSRPILKTCRRNILSSMRPLVISLYTRTSFV